MKESLSILADESCLPFPVERIVHPDFERESSILDYRVMVIESMVNFAIEVNAGQLSEYIATFPRGDRKNERTMPDAEFMLLPSIVDTQPDSVWGVNFGDTVAGAMCQDGDFGFSLAYVKEPQDKLTLLAISSFMTPSKIRNGDYYGFDDILEPDFPDAVPVIVQLQGSSSDTFSEVVDGELHRKDAANMIQQFRWEEVLVRLISAWAKNAGLKQIGILSAAKNYYSSDDFERYHRRYNKTAARLGFSFNDGIHLLDLQ